MVNHPNRKKKTGLLKFNVLNRFSGEVQFTAEIDSTEDAATSFKLGLAAKWAIESRADLSGADLSGANLSRADLSGAKDADHAIACTRILPDGDLIGWKKCNAGVIVKLRIPESAKRSHAFGRKCRAEFADVLEVVGAEFGVGQHDGKTEYRVGQRVTPDKWDENWQEECSNGIHFYITRAEAEAH
jgi:hypothetical protein